MVQVLSAESRKLKLQFTFSPKLDNRRLKKMFPCLMSLDLRCDIWMVRSDLSINSMKGCIPSCFGSIIQGAAAGVIV